MIRCIWSTLLSELVVMVACIIRYIRSSMSFRWQSILVIVYMVPYCNDIVVLIYWHQVYVCWYNIDIILMYVYLKGFDFFISWCNMITIEMLLSKSCDTIVIETILYWLYLRIVVTNWTVTRYSWYDIGVDNWRKLYCSSTWLNGIRVLYSCISFISYIWSCFMTITIIIGPNNVWYVALVWIVYIVLFDHFFWFDTIVTWK